jgi:hypothetical protein
MTQRGRPSKRTGERIRLIKERLRAGQGICKIAWSLRCGVDAVYRIRNEMVAAGEIGERKIGRPRKSLLLSLS